MGPGQQPAWRWVGRSTAAAETALVLQVTVLWPGPWGGTGCGAQLPRQTHLPPASPDAARLGLPGPHRRRRLPGRLPAAPKQPDPGHDPGPLASAVKPRGPGQGCWQEPQDSRHWGALQAPRRDRWTGVPLVPGTRAPGHRSCLQPGGLVASTPLLGDCSSEIPSHVARGGTRGRGVPRTLSAAQERQEVQSVWVPVCLRSPG